MSKSIDDQVGSARVGAGLIDAGAAALATFLASAYAVWVLSPEELGAHALAFSAMVMIAFIPERLVFLPTLAVSVERKPAARLGYYREGLRLALPLAPLIVAFVVLFFLLPDGLADIERVALAACGAAAALFHSAQLFARQILHYADRSRTAIAASLLRLVVTGAAIFVFSQTELPVVAIPLAALATGNVVVATWVAILRPIERVARLSVRAIYPRGSYLVASSIVPSAAGFITANLVIAFGGAALLGFAEAARIVAQPVFVGATGLSMATNPRVMSGARTGDTEAVARARRIYLGALWAGGLAYAAFLVLPGVGSAVEALFPTAFEITGLVAISVLAQIVLGMTRPYAAEAIALEREPAILVSELPGAVIVIGFGLVVPVVGAFAVPAGLLGAGLTRTAILRHMLAEPTPKPTSEAGITPTLDELSAAEVAE